MDKHNWSSDDTTSFAPKGLPSITTPEELPRKKKSYGLANNNEFQTATSASNSSKMRSVIPSNVSKARSIEAVVTSTQQLSSNPLRFESLSTKDSQVSSPKEKRKATTIVPGATFSQAKSSVRTPTLDLAVKYSSPSSSSFLSKNENGMRQLSASKLKPNLVTPVATTPTRRTQPKRNSKNIKSLNDFVSHDEDDLPIYTPPPKRQTRRAAKNNTTKEGSSAMPIELDDEEGPPMAPTSQMKFPQLATPPPATSQLCLIHAYFISCSSRILIAQDHLTPSVCMGKGNFEFYMDALNRTRVIYTDIEKCISGTINVSTDEHFLYLFAKGDFDETIFDATEREVLIVSNGEHIMAMREKFIENITASDRITILPEAETADDKYIQTYMEYRSVFQAPPEPTGIVTRRRGRSKGPPAPQHIILVYPFEKDANDVITVYSGDLRRLRDDDFLNDNIIDFQVRELIKQSPNARLIYGFSCLFYPKLTDCPSKSGDHSLVANWTKSIDIFSKAIVLVPINSGSHWSLVCLLNIGNEVPPTILDGNEEEKHDAAKNVPCMLFMDSLGCHSLRTIRRIMCEYLSKEWKDKKKTERNYSQLPCIDISSLLPRQSNSYDCGVFIIKYVEHIIRLFPSSTPEDIESKFDRVFSKSLFTDADIAAERVQIRENLERLSKEYGIVMKERREQSKEEADETPAEILQKNETADSHMSPVSDTEMDLEEPISEKHTDTDVDSTMDVDDAIAAVKREVESEQRFGRCNDDIQVDYDNTPIDLINNQQIPTTHEKIMDRAWSTIPEYKSMELGDNSNREASEVWEVLNVDRDGSNSATGSFGNVYMGRRHKPQRISELFHS